MHRLAALLISSALPAVVYATPVDWVDWISTSGAGTVATGTIHDSASNSAITVTFTGYYAWADTTSVLNLWSPFPGTYTSPTVPNGPPNGEAIGLAFLGGTLSFSQPVTDPVMAISSLGTASRGSRWTFNAPFTVLTFGAGYNGSGFMTGSLGNNTLLGYEGNGTLRFHGTYSTISIDVADGENWAAFTVGIPAPGSAVAGGLAGLWGMRRRR